MPQSWIGPLREKHTHAAPVLTEGLHIKGLHPDFLSFIAVAQGLNVEFLPTTWEPARGQLGEGTSGRVYQSNISNDTSLAFKSPIISGSDLDEAMAFRALICEVLILRHPIIRQHMNIIELQGITWEVVPNGSKVRPVLVFPLTPCGTLWGYMEARVRQHTFDSRLKMCLDIGSALATMHSCSTYPRFMDPASQHVTLTYTCYLRYHSWRHQTSKCCYFPFKIRRTISHTETDRFWLLLFWQHGQRPSNIAEITALARS